jgi:hypothetical protein
MWYNGQSYWLKIRMSRLRFLGLPDFLRSSGSRNPRLTAMEKNRAAAIVDTKFADQRRSLSRYNSLVE